MNEELKKPDYNNNSINVINQQNIEKYILDLDSDLDKTINNSINNDDITELKEKIYFNKKRTFKEKLTFIVYILIGLINLFHSFHFFFSEYVRNINNLNLNIF